MHVAFSGENPLAFDKIEELRTLLLLLLVVPAAWPAGIFLGAAGGVSTLKPDARLTGSPPQLITAYKPENGPEVLLFAGRHLNDYFSLQGSLGWNRNSIALAGADVAASRSFVQPARVTMVTLVAEAMLYFRPRSSWVRPYLSAGPGLVHSRTAANGPAVVMGSIHPPALPFTSTDACLRAAVGIDLRMGHHAGFRYSFSETLQSNPLSRSLQPPGQRKLANFQNWWGFTWSF